MGLEDLPRDVVVHILRKGGPDAVRGVGIAPGRLVVPAALEQRLSEQCRLRIRVVRERLTIHLLTPGGSRYFYDIRLSTSGCNVMRGLAGEHIHRTCYWSGASIPASRTTARCRVCDPPDELGKFVIVVLLAAVEWVLEIIRLR